MTDPTRIRYEVYASKSGTAADWRLVPGGAGFDATAAVAMAERYAESHAATCVESWDDGRNVFLRTVWNSTYGAEVLS